MIHGRKKVSAELCSYVDEEKCMLNFEISIPGVKKEDIVLKLLDDGFCMTAPKDDIDYVTSGTFCCPVKAGDAKATYDNGLLKVGVPFKDVMENSVDVQIA